MRSALVISALLLATSAFAQNAALVTTPPMGWNSWDAYGTTIDEKQFRASAQWVASYLKPAGYQYVTIDEGWYEGTPGAADKNEHLVVDSNGRFIPDSVRFPSSTNGTGLAQLADYVHSLGLKLGIHVLQGIPKAAVTADSPIEGSSFHAKQAANIAASCQWDTKTWDLQENDAAQAYYDSIVRLYASWQVDLIKIDCIASRPYKGEEIRMFHEAIAKSGRPIILSLSPGAAPMNEAENMRAYSQQRRISDDVWDIWESTGTFPQGINDQITRAAKWTPWAGRGVWPDLDMLPLGQLRPAPGWGAPRASRLTLEEQRSMINLWSIVRSPLIYGGDPQSTDDATLALLTNADVIAVDQHSHNNYAIMLNKDYAVYIATPDSGPGTYIAVFNRQDAPQTVTVPWSKLGLAQPTTRPYKIKDLWTKSESVASTLTLPLAPHASTILLIH